MITACATQPEEVVEEVPAEEVVEEEAPVVEEEVAEVEEEAVVEEAVEEEAPAVEEEAPVVEEAVVEPVVETFRLIGTNGLLSLAVATYEGGFGLDDVSAVVEYAKAGAPTLVLDAGTNAVSIPDLPLGMEDGAALAAVVDAIGYAAMTPGVADFSFGTAGLQMLDEAADMAVVSANAAGLAPSTMIEYKGIKVGIFGLTSPKANAKGANVSPVMADIMAAAEKAVMDLKADGADVVIALTNMGYEQAGFTAGELDWAAEYMDGYVDLIIDGMGSIPYSEIRGNTMYVQLGGQVGALEITVTDGVITGVETLLIDEEMIAGLKPNTKVAGLLAAEGERLARLAAQAAAAEEVPVVAEEVVVEEAAAAVAAEVVEKEAVVEEAVEEEAAVVTAEETGVIETPAAAPTLPSKRAEGLLDLTSENYYEVKSPGEKNRFTLTLLYTGNVFARLSESDDTGMGAAKLATVIEYVTSVSDSTLILDAGNTFYGTTAASVSQGAIIAELMNGVYDAMIPGSYDFAFGIDRLLELDADVDFPVISSNITDGQDFIFQPYKIFDFHGFSVGVIGLTAPEVHANINSRALEGVVLDRPPASLGQDTVSGDTETIATAEQLFQTGIDLLREEADMIILLTQLDPDNAYGVSADTIASSINGIDLIIDGNSKREAHDEVIYKDTVIVSAGRYGDSIGIINVAVEQDEIASITPFIYTKEEAEELEPYPAIVQYISDIDNLLEDYTSIPVGSIPYTLDGERAHIQKRPTNLGSMLTTAMLEMTDADIALINSGSIRNSIAAGTVTVADVITAIPYEESVAVIEITGAQLKQLLEAGIRYLPNPSPDFLQFSGFTAIWNRFNDPGKRLFKVTVGKDRLDDSQSYLAAIPDQLLVNSAFDFLSDTPVVANHGLLIDLFTSYIREYFPFTD